MGEHYAVAIDPPGTGIVEDAFRILVDPASDDVITLDIFIACPFTCPGWSEELWQEARTNVVDFDGARRMLPAIRNGPVSDFSLATTKTRLCVCCSAKFRKKVGTQQSNGSSGGDGDNKPAVEPTVGGGGGIIINQPNPPLWVVESPPQFSLMPIRIVKFTNENCEEMYPFFGIAFDVAMSFWGHHHSSAAGSVSAADSILSELHQCEAKPASKYSDSFHVKMSSKLSRGRVVMQTLKIMFSKYAVEHIRSAMPTQYVHLLGLCYDPLPGIEAELSLSNQELESTSLGLISYRSYLKCRGSSCTARLVTDPKATNAAFTFSPPLQSYVNLHNLSLLMDGLLGADEVPANIRLSASQLLHISEHFRKKDEEQYTWSTNTLRSLLDLTAHGTELIALNRNSTQTYAFVGLLARDGTRVFPLKHYAAQLPITIHRQEERRRITMGSKEFTLIDDPDDSGKKINTIRVIVATKTAVRYSSSRAIPCLVEIVIIFEGCAMAPKTQIQGMCRFGTRCRNADCEYTHVVPRNGFVVKMNAQRPSQEILHRGPPPCKNGSECTFFKEGRCRYRHE